MFSYKWENEKLLKSYTQSKQSFSRDALEDEGRVVGTLTKILLGNNQRSVFQAANSIHSGQCYQCKMKWAKESKRVCQLFL